jgi:hypothetical protein
MGDRKTDGVPKINQVVASLRGAPEPSHAGLGRSSREGQSSIRRISSLIFECAVIFAGVLLGLFEASATVHHRILWVAAAALIGIGAVALWEDLVGPVRR